MVNPAIDPTLGITPFQPFVFDDRPQNQWRLLPAPPRTKGGDVPNYQDHELIIFDLGGGLNKTRGRIFPHYLGVDLGDSNKTSSANGVDVSYPSQAILSTFANTEAVWRSDHQVYSSLYIYDNLFIAEGTNPTIQISFTNGSALISTFASGPHGLAPNDLVEFTTTGGLPVNFATATPYYVKTVYSPSVFSVSAAPGGVEIVAGSAGTGVQTLHVYNRCLWKENASTGGLVGVPLDPASAIVNLSELQFDNTAPKMAVGIKDGQGFTLASDLSTMVGFNDTNTFWGGCVSPLGDGGGTNIMMFSATGANNTVAGLLTIPVSSAASAVPNDTLTRFNSGGYCVGIANIPVTPGNLVPRIAWVIPRVPNSSGMFVTNALPPKADIIHTNLYGTDPQYLLTNLPWVTHCIVHDGVLYYTDTFTIMKNDGTETDLGWVYDREQDSDYKYQCCGLGYARGQFVAQVCRLNLTTVASSQMWFEKMDSSDKTRPRWYMCSKVLSPDLTTTVTDLGPGYVDRSIVSFPTTGLAYSLKSQMMYLLPQAGTGTEKDYFQFIPAPGYSHFLNYRYTAGSTKAGQKTEASGTYDSPELAFPFPLKGLPTVIIGMGIYGDLNAGGTGGSSVLSTAKLEQFTQGIGGKLTYSSTSRVSHTVGYRDGLRHEQRWKSFIDEDGNINAPVDPFNLFKYRMTITQDDSRTDWTPNALPIVFHFRTYTNGRVD